MISLDDSNILNLYERNISFYHNCYNKKHYTIETNEKNINTECIGTISDDNGYCLCHLKYLSKPIEFGDKYFKRPLHTKGYVKLSDPKLSKCAICLELILHKKNCFLTSCCGSSFHKKCITNAKMYNSINTPNQLSCPLCREIIPDDFAEFNYKYNSSSPKFNYLDKLENFWDNIEFIEPLICICQEQTQTQNGHKLKSHFLGLGKNCFECDNYNKSGKYYNF